MQKLKLLDLFCGGGGAAAGYAAAGFDVTGVDIVAHKNYPYLCFQQISESIPPAYTKYICELFIDYLNNKK